MIKMKELKGFGAVLIASIYVVIVAIVSIYIHQALSSVGLCTAEKLCILKIPLHYFIPIFSAVGLITGGVMFYLISEKTETSIRICEQDYNKKIDELLRRVLGEKMYSVYNLCKKENITQAKISKSLNLSRVEVFRILKKLEEKGLIERKKNGKVVYVSAKEI
ncbi:MAG: MarR family transcriptional regulator [Nanoarchaeota archaeon]|nr:MarR family transcriptional regulator [Nanoarchaeota archaeon]